jgi:hypothetical protein
MTFEYPLEEKIDGHNAVLVSYNGFSKKENAEKKCSKLKKEGYAVEVVKSKLNSVTKFFIVRSKEKIQ